MIKNFQYKTFKQQAFLAIAAAACFGFSFTAQATSFSTHFKEQGLVRKFINPDGVPVIKTKAEHPAINHDKECLIHHHILQLGGIEIAYSQAGVYLWQRNCYLKNGHAVMSPEVN